MVRHEAAEALGGIASDGIDDEMDTDDQKLPEGGVLAILREWAVKEEAPVVVRESCQVAVDMWEVRFSSRMRGQERGVDGQLQALLGERARGIGNGKPSAMGYMPSSSSSRGCTSYSSFA